MIRIVFGFFLLFVSCMDSTRNGDISDRFLNKSESWDRKIRSSKLSDTVSLNIVFQTARKLWLSVQLDADFELFINNHLKGGEKRQNIQSCLLNNLNNKQNEQEAAFVAFKFKDGKTAVKFVKGKDSKKCGYSMIFYEFPDYYIGFARDVSTGQGDEYEEPICGYFYINKNDMMPVFILAKREMYSVGNKFKFIERIFCMDDELNPALSVVLFRNNIQYISKFIYLNDSDGIYGEQVKIPYPVQLGDMQRVDSTTTFNNIYEILGRCKGVEIGDMPIEVSGKPNCFPSWVKKSDPYILSTQTEKFKGFIQ